MENISLISPIKALEEKEKAAIVTNEENIDTNLNISIKDLICHDKINLETQNESTLDEVEPLIPVEITTQINESKEVTKKPKTKSNRTKKNLSKSKKSDVKTKKDTVLKNTKSLRWSDPVESIDFASINSETPKTTHIKLKQPSHKSMNNIQNLTCIDSDALFVMDFHSHITRSKIGGYLLGTYYNLTNSLHITEAYPLLEGFSEDTIVREEIENSVRALVKERQKVDPTYVVCGRYFNNIDLQPEPTIQDVIDHETIHHNMIDVSHETLFLSMIISPFYDPKFLSNIESSICLFKVNSTLKTQDNIPPPIKCEFKKNMSDLSQNSLDKITLISYHAQKIGTLLNMSTTFWADITLQMKLIASNFQHVNIPSTHQSALIEYISKITQQSTETAPLC